MALGGYGDVVTFTPSAGQPGAGVVQTGVVIGVVPAVSNKVAYNFSINGGSIDWAHEAVVASVTVLTNQTKHCGGC